MHAVDPHVIIRGRPFRTFLLFGSVMFVAMSLFSVWIWLSDGSARSRIVEIAFLWLLVLAVTASFSLGAALTYAEIKNGVIRFVTFGITTRRISLKDIRGCEGIARRGLFRLLLHDDLWYCPNGFHHNEGIVRALQEELGSDFQML